MRGLPRRRDGVLSPVLCVLLLCVISAQFVIMRRMMRSDDVAAAPATAANQRVAAQPPAPVAALAVVDEAAKRVQQLRDAAAAAPPPSHYDKDPLPGVHMVYMYANGSDPAIAMRKPLYGGASGGGAENAACSDLPRCSRRPRVMLHAVTCISSEIDHCTQRCAVGGAAVTLVRCWQWPQWPPGPPPLASLQC